MNTAQIATRREIFRVNLTEAVLSALFLAPFALLAGQGIVRSLGAAYAVIYGLVMLPSATIGFLFLVDAVRASVGKRMTWVPAVLYIIAQTDEKTLAHGATKPWLQGNFLLVILVNITVLVFVVSSRARRAYAEAQQATTPPDILKSSDRLPSRAPGYMLDHQIGAAVNLLSGHTGEFATR